MNFIEIYISIYIYIFVCSVVNFGRNLKGHLNADKWWGKSIKKGDHKGQISKNKK